MYVVARINSILAKSKVKSLKSKVKFELLNKPEEKQLLLLLARYEEITIEALRQYNPSIITRYCFDLAQQFNNFYNKYSVLKAEDNDLILARLQLSKAVKNVLENAFGLLTINTVEEM